MSGTEQGAGWLPVEAQDALAADRQAAARTEASRLLALAPRDRVIALMRFAAAKGEAGRMLDAATLAEVVASFEGTDMPDAEELRALCPAVPAAA